MISYLCLQRFLIYFHIIMTKIVLGFWIDYIFSTLPCWHLRFVALISSTFIATFWSFLSFNCTFSFDSHTFLDFFYVPHIVKLFHIFFGYFVFHTFLYYFTNLLRASFILYHEILKVFIYCNSFNSCCFVDAKTIEPMFSCWQWSNGVHGRLLGVWMHVFLSSHEKCNHFASTWVVLQLCWWVKSWKLGQCLEYHMVFAFSCDTIK